MSWTDGSVNGVGNKELETLMVPQKRIYNL